MEDRSLRVKFGIDRAGVFASSIDHIPDVNTVELDNAIYKGSQNWIESITIRRKNSHSIRGHLQDSANIDVIELRQLSQRSGTHYLIGFVTERDPFILTSLAENDAIPYRIVADSNRLQIVAVVEDWNHLKELAGKIEDDFEAFELLETTPTDGEGSPLGLDSIKRIFRGKLTESQLHLLETAYRMGYFEVPQRATSEEVAKELDISQPTFSERLRRAETRMYGLVFGETLE